MGLFFFPSELFLVFRCLRMFGDHCDEIEALLPLLVLTKPSMLSVSCVLGAGEMRVRFEEVRTRDGTSEPRLKLSKTEFRSGEPPRKSDSSRFRVSGFGFRVSSLETNFRCRFRVSGFGVRVSGFDRFWGS